MLIAADLSPNVQLVGSGLGGASAISALQQALTGLAIGAGWPAANPGGVTGSITPQTVSAVTAVVANLGGKIDGKIKTAIQVASALASVNVQAMGALKTAISSYAPYLTPAIIALSLKYTKSPVAPPMPAAPPSNATLHNTFFTSMVPGLKFHAASTTGNLPAGSIQTRSKNGMYRVAAPSGIASQLGGPSVSLGAAFQELPSRTTPVPNVRFVSEPEFEKDTGTRPFYKKPLYWGGLAAGVAVLGGGAYWMTRG